jgi:DNA polymerase III delta prime subunit
MYTRRVLSRRGRNCYTVQVKPSFYLPHLSSHSHYLIGSEKVHGELKTILEEVHGISIQGNPDFFESVHEVFTIDDARALREMHGIRPVHISGKKIVIITMQGITGEAQNALLKLLEEPAEYAYFFLIVPSAHLLLPTVKSRLTLIDTPHAQGKENSTEAVAFVKASPIKRLDITKKLLDDISKEKKTKQDAIHFLDQVQRVVYEKRGVKEGLKSLEAIEMARNYIHDRAPSLKMLLEFVALNV